MSEGTAEFEIGDVSKQEEEEDYLVEVYQQQYLERLLGTQNTTLSAEQINAFQILAKELAVEKRDDEKKYQYDRLMKHLLTRAALDDNLERVFKLKERQGNPSGALLFIDVNNLKKLNDSLGHGVGDEALRVVDGSLGETIRSGDTAGRYGGDEVVIFLEDVDIKEAALIANRTRQTLRTNAAPLREQTKGLADISFSIGIVPYRRGVAVKDALKQADEAMYTAKHQLNKDAIVIAGLDNPQVIEDTHKFLKENGVNAPIVSTPLARVVPQSPK